MRVLLGAALLAGAAIAVAAPTAGLVNDAAVTGQGYPATLAEFGFFADAPGQRAAVGVTPYRIQTPLWSDGSEKLRFVYLPAGQKAKAQGEGLLDLPVGAALIKTFKMQGRLIETRVLLHRAEGWVALVTLIAMEVVLGIDNLIFISILSNKLPEADRSRARRLGIGAALIMRLLLLATVSYIAQLTAPVFTLFDHGFSWRDMILIAGGLFLVWKATKEIHHSVDPEDTKDNMVGNAATLTVGGAIFQILLLDLVFSVDSIITAVGMTDHLAIMYIAVVVAVAVMLLAADPLARFIHANPTIVMLALGFLLMIGMTLIADGMGFHVPKGYVYAAMGFSALVELLNMLARRARRRRQAASGGTATKH